jgi:hypothetical protein
VVDHREADPIVWLDRPSYLQGTFRAFLKAAVIEIPFVVGKHRAGSLRGHGFRVDAAKLTPDAGDSGEIFDRMVQRNRSSDLGELQKGPTHRVDSEFKSRSIRWNLLLARSHSRTREDTVTFQDDDGALLREEFQVEKSRRWNWSFVDNGETRALSVEGFLGAPGGDSSVLVRPIVVVRYGVDDLNTHSDELDRYYEFLTGLGSGGIFMPEDFSATEWNVNPEVDGRWGRLLTSGSVHLHSGALDQLLRLERADYWPVLARRLKVSESEFTRYREQMRSASPKRRKRLRYSSLGRRVDSALVRSWHLLHTLRSARRAEDEEQRLRRIVKALYIANFQSGGSHDSLVMGALLEAIGFHELTSLGQLFLEGRITKPFADELILPERAPLVGSVGQEEEFQQLRFRFFPSNGIELYKTLDWLRDIEP